MEVSEARVVGDPSVRVARDVVFVSLSVMGDVIVDSKVFVKRRVAESEVVVSVQMKVHVERETEVSRLFWLFDMMTGNLGGYGLSCSNALVLARGGRRRPPWKRIVLTIVFAD
jgi:hypothetical protein